MPPRFPSRAFTALPINGTPPTAPPVAARAAPDHSHSIHSTAHASSSRLPPTYPLQRCSRRASNPSLGRASASKGFHSSASAGASAKDPYDVLGVKRDAAAGDIKKAYYQLAKKWHPDSNQEKGANERFVEIQAAYDILSDDKKRQAYDRYGSASQQEGFDPDGFARGAGGFGGFQDFGSAFGGRAGNAGDLFEQLFGGAFGGGRAGAGGGFGGAGQSGRSRMMRGDDLEASINLSFEDAAAGVKRTINITPVVDCQPCSGSGLKPGKQKTQCGTCRGTGQQTFQVQGMLMASTCQACGGAGSSIPKDAKCGDCAGLGRVKEKRPVEVEIPAGIDDGMKVKMPGLGDMPLGAQGPPGDLFVRVKVAKSAHFRRSGTHLYHDAKVPLHTAMLGGRVRIPTLEGDVEVRVREGTQHGQEAVLKGRGLKDVYGTSRLRNERGDLIVSWQVQIPRSMTPLQKRLMKAFGEAAEGGSPEVHFGPLPPSGSESAPAPGSGSASASASASETVPSSPTAADADVEAKPAATATARNKSKAKDKVTGAAKAGGGGGGRGVDAQRDEPIGSDATARAGAAGGSAAEEGDAGGRADPKEADAGERGVEGEAEAEESDKKRATG